MSSEAFQAIMACLDPRMVVVTTAADGEQAGCLVGFHAQSSIEPERYCLWLSKANHTYRVGLRATHLAVHFLTKDDLALAELFGTTSGDSTDKFAHVPFETSTGGVPVLRQVSNRLVVRRNALLDEGGDHVCVVTDVLSATSTGRFDPLLLSQVSHLTPGHESEERPAPPTERAPG